MQASPCLIPLAAIRTDGTQLRARPDPGMIEEYAAALRDGAEFPPAVVYAEGADYWLADGHHRFAAAREAGRSEILAEVRVGGRRDAILYAAGANATHGLRRTNADKKHAVTTLLMDPEWSAWSDREIARRAGVGAPFVGRLRRELSVSGLQIGERTAVRGGTTYQIRLPTKPEDQPSTSALLETRTLVSDVTPAPPRFHPAPGEWWRLGLHRIFCGSLAHPAWQFPATPVPLAVLPLDAKAAAQEGLRGAAGAFVFVPPADEPGRHLPVYEAFMARWTELFDFVLAPELRDPDLLLAAELTDRRVLGCITDPGELARALTWYAEATEGEPERCAEPPFTPAR